jgi:hypothetical protein
VLVVNNTTFVFDTDFLPEEGIYKSQYIEAPNVTSVVSCFTFCTKLGAITRPFLDKCTSLIFIISLFNNCTGLTSVNVELFKYNTNIKEATSCFSGCTGLTSINVELFSNKTHPYLNKLSSCFINCSALTSDVNTIINYTVPTGVITTATTCFYMCSKLTGSGNMIIINAFSAVTPSIGVFYKCTSLSDYNNLPSGWK